ncbi:GNAT family N-acetyltransferase [Antrihabitans stalactiti]|uniref:GNAT family N-acetyltransferase n=1 Tax=Antrihabitans stalactiti TaxID=2584121 RepID=A0A848K8W2_9NOCA|nr:GNAT family N-acetyltransferase [Antrihabitans stalactiti]NMN94086.1 GNAT family N-acetyltransferase [Antrihabitans stalactiti]
MADVLASDGGVVHMRPITPADADRLVAFHSGLSERTRYLRYFGPYPTMSAKDVARSTNVDHRNRVSLVTILGGEIIAVGLYERLKDPDSSEAWSNSAEVAFVVADAHQGRGLGSILLEHLAGAAAENSIDVFVAEVLAENRGMVTVFKEAGYQVSRSIDGSVLHLEFRIDPTEALLSVRNSRERASEARSVRNLLSPTSVAVIGASTQVGKVGNTVLSNLLGANFTGPVFPVNTDRRSVQGVRAYATVRDIPDDVDLAVVAVPATQIDAVLDDCMEKGVKGLIVLSAGFAETGPDGFEAQRRLVQEARGHGMRLVGPNALGIANADPAVALNATLAPVMPARGRVGFFCQSGPLGAAILGEAHARRLGLSTFVSAGNRADVSGNDLLQYWDSDPETDVILLYLESFGNPRKFSRIARRVARTKPIVAVRSGRGATRARGAHTEIIDNSIAADLFAQAGVIQVESISELFDCAVLVGYQPLPTSSRLAVVGNSAALAWLAVGAAEAEGLLVDDPINLPPEAGPDDFAEAVRSAIAAPDIGSLIAIVVPPVYVQMAPFAAALRSAVSGFDKPVVTTFFAEQGIAQGLEVNGPDGNPIAGSIPSYPDPERAARALGRVWRYSQWRSRPASRVVRPTGIDADRGRELIAGWAENAGSRWLSDLEVVELLAAYGIDIVDFREVSSADEAVAAAAELGYPVAAKATGEMWRSRPDLSGVRLDLNSEESVGTAYHDLAAVSGQPLLHIQRMAKRGVGCVVRVQDDPSFGSVVSFGLSGLILDLLGDRAYRALPLTEDDAHILVDAPRAAPLLSGTATTEPVDKEALVDVLQRISALCDDLPEIRELLCEPILASRHGAELLFARVRIGPEPSHLDLGPRRLS